MTSTPAPVFIDRGLDGNDVVSGDGPFSDSKGQQSHCITEKDSDACLKKKWEKF
jgi:hypothetical protein